MDFSQLFGNQSGAFEDYANQMRNIGAGYQGYVDTGNQSRGLAFDQYKQLTSNPNFLQDMITSGFYESPYQKLVQDLVTKRMNYNAANTGMLGSGAANRALQDELTASTGQFLNDYIGRGMNSFGMGLTGLNDFTKLGLGALNDQSGYLEQGAAANLKGDQSEQGWLSKLIGTGLGVGAGALAGFRTGGVPGAITGGVRSLISNPNRSTIDLGVTA